MAKFWHRALGLLGIAAAALALSGCGVDDEAAADGRKTVLTTFTVIADMARQVAGDRLYIASITKPGAEIHGYEPTPSDLVRAARADLIVQNGMGLERWFDQFIERSGAPRATLTTGIEPISIAGESEYRGKPNPHAWMSTDNAAIYVENLYKAFSKLDPAGEPFYRANADRYQRELLAVGKEVKADLARLPANQRALVTCEGAFSYLARDLGLSEAYLWPVNAEREGTPQQIASTVEFVRERKVPAVFCESTMSPEAQEQVAKEAGSRFGGVLYVDSLSKPDGPVPSYLELLRKDAQTIAAGLGATKEGE